MYMTKKLAVAQVVIHSSRRFRFKNDKESNVNALSPNGVAFGQSCTNAEQKKKNQTIQYNQV